jgi:hypothetical protein
LHLVLAKIRGTHQSTAFLDGWSAALNVKGDDRPEMLRSLAQVLAMPAQAKAALEAVPDVNQEIQLRWYGPVCDYLARAALLNSTPSSAGVTVDEATLLSLEMCSDTLHRHFPDAVVTEDQLAQIAELINELKLAVETARNDENLDPELDKFLSGLVGTLARGITDFPLKGVEALAEAYDLFYGRAVRNPAAAQKVQKEHPKVWDGMKRAIAALGLAITVLNSGVQLEQNIAHAIGGPAAPSTTRVEVVVVEEPGPNSPAVRAN